jgi:tetratricopeptide (TPR) repeat protein
LGFFTGLFWRERFSGEHELQKAKLHADSLALARMGDYERASAMMQEYLSRDPRNGEAWNDLGVMHFERGNLQEAMRSFERAVEELPSPGQAYMNFAEAYFSAGRADRVSSLFGGMKEAGVLDSVLVKRVVETFVDGGDRAGAMEAALKGAEVMPEDRETGRLVESIKSGRARIAIFCGGDGMTFMQDIYDFMKERFEVRIFDGDRTEQVRELMEWSDISWFEWCTNLAEIGSKMPKVCKNIIRLHRYEAYLDWPSRINWENIDILLTVGNSCVNEVLERQVPNIGEQVRMITVANGVDLDKFKYVKRRHGKKIAFVGNLRMVKNPMFVLHCMEALVRKDADYKLFFAGRFTDAVVEQYLVHMVDELGLKDNVVFEGWQGDVQLWLEDKHYIVSSSVIESQGMGILEGMACGLKPVVHNFPGARGTFGREFVFNTVEDFCSQILSEDYRAERYRGFVEYHYSLEMQLGRINEVLAGLEEESGGKTGCCEGDFAGSQGVPGGNQMQVV